MPLLTKEEGGSQRMWRTFTTGIVALFSVVAINCASADTGAGAKAAAACADKYPTCHKACPDKAKDIADPDKRAFRIFACELFCLDDQRQCLLKAVEIADEKARELKQKATEERKKMNIY